MICEKCGHLDYEVHKTIRGIEFDLREVCCSRCKRFFYQQIIKIDREKFDKIKTECQSNRNITNQTQVEIND